MTGFLSFERRIEVERSILNTLNNAEISTIKLQGLTERSVARWLLSSTIQEDMKIQLHHRLLRVIELLSGSKIYTSLGQARLTCEVSEAEVFAAAKEVLNWPASHDCRV